MDQQTREFRRDVGGRLREVEKGFTNRAAAAAAAGVAKSTLQNWIEGKADPSFEGLVRLAKAADVEIHWLATGEGPKGVSGGVEGAAAHLTGAPPLDQDLMEAVLAAVYDYMERRGLRARSGEDFQKLCMALYDLAKEGEGTKELDLTKYNNVVGLATFQRGQD